MSITNESRDITLIVVLNNESISESTLRMLLALLGAWRPKIIVEAGTYKGTFAVSMAKLCEDAQVYTADAIDHNWNEALVVNEVTDRVHFINADFEEIAVRHPEVVGTVDVAFIDSGWPMTSYETGMRVRHFRAAQQWVKPGGYVLVDDMASRDWAGAEDIAAQCCLILPTDRGLGLWRKHV